MRTVDRQALVAFSPQQMYALVADIEAYPQFLPWCTSARLQEKTATQLTASIGLGLGALNTEFTTRNDLQPPSAMSMELQDGPFSFLRGDWAFEALGDAGSEVRLRVDFEFDNAAQDILFGAAFEKICNELIDAFVRRANELYGDD